MRILVAEDDATLAAGLSGVLAKAGHSVSQFGHYGSKPASTDIPVLSQDSTDIDEAAN